MNRRSLVAVGFFMGLLLAISVWGNERASDKGKGDEAQAAIADGAIVPEIDRCTIEVDERVCKPTTSFSPGEGGRFVGGLRVQMEKGVLRAFRMGNAKPQWIAKIPEEVELAWLAADKTIIYLAGYKIDKKSGELLPELPLRIRRLALASGKWLADLAVDAKPHPKEIESIQCLLTGGGRVVALTITTDEDKGWDGAGQQVSYRVSCFKGGKARPEWSKTIPSAGKVRRPNAALLWAARSPAKVQPDLQQLAWLGEDVLVCAGPVQDLLCLEAGTGKESWRVERVWEYERGFIGPSVWQHVFRRGGTGGDEKKGGKHEKKENRPSGLMRSIIGGPVVVDAPRNSDGERSQRIFVAVAKGPGKYGEYLSDCVVYELASDGKPRAMANLPRMIWGGHYRIQKDGIVWACQGGAFVKLSISHNESIRLGMGPGGPDLLCRVDWYRHLSTEQPDAWLTSGPAGDPVSFDDGVAFRVCSGGYVMDANAGVYCFPLSIIDLKTGMDRGMVLRVPYKGKLPDPKTNFNRTQASTGKAQWHTSGPHILAITGLHVENKKLSVTLGMEEWSRRVEFDLDELQRRTKK